MSELDDITAKLEEKRSLISQLIETLAEVAGNEEAVKELDYSFGQKYLAFVKLNQMSDETTETIIPKLKSLLEFVAENKRDETRAVANEIAEIVGSDS